MTPLLRSLLLDGAFSPYRLAGLAARYDAAAGSTLTASASGRVSQWSDYSGKTRHLTQATGAAQPLFFPWVGENYGYLPGVAANYFSTPSSAALNITGDLTLTVDLYHASWRPSAEGGLIGKWSGQYLLTLNTDGTLVYYYHDGGVKSVISTAALPSAAARWIVQVRQDVDNGAAGTDTSFWYRATASAAWTQLGATVTAAGAITRTTGATAVEVGTWATGTNPTAGRVYAATVGTGLGDAATTVAQFSPGAATHESTSFVSLTGETWTINASGQPPARLVGQASVLFDGSDDMLAGAVSGLGTIASAFTALLVVRMVAIPSSKFLTETTASAGAVNGHGLNTTATNVFNSYRNAASGYFGSGITIGTANRLILAHTGEGVTRRTYVNGAAGAAQVDTAVATNAINGLALGGLYGGGLYANMHTCEYLVYTRALTSAEMAAAARYLARKWRIAL